MCDTCGCNITPGNKHLLEANGRLAKTPDGNQAIDVLQSLLHENDHQARHNRQHFDTRGVLAINLMSSPGSGKTALLEKTIELLADKFRVAVVEGDLETENDAERIRAKGVPAVQITTGSACHLDAHMVHDGLHQLDLDDIDILFIENVGNLVCPASFDLGHHLNVTLLSTTEGDDKPAKYPVMFRAADLMLVTKVDLLQVLDDFSVEKTTRHFRELAKSETVMTISSKTGEGMNNWLDWLVDQLSEYRAALKNGQSRRPNIQSEGAAKYVLEISHHQHAHSHGHKHDHHDEGS